MKHKNELIAIFLEKNRKNIWRREIPLILNQFDIKDKQILDAGCDEGYFSFYLYTRSPKLIIGVDFDPDRIKKARVNQFDLKIDETVNFIVQDLHEIDETTNFDLILFSEVYEHLENPATVIRMFNNVLTDGGYLIISTPNSDSIVGKLARFIGVNVLKRSTFDEKAHKNEPTRKEILGVLRSAGFFIVSDYYYGISKIDLLYRVRMRSLVRFLANLPLFGKFLGTNIAVIAKKDN